MLQNISTKGVLFSLSGNNTLSRMTHFQGLSIDLFSPGTQFVHFRVDLFSEGASCFNFSQERIFSVNVCSPLHQYPSEKVLLKKERVCIQREKIVSFIVYAFLEGRY